MLRYQQVFSTLFAVFIVWAIALSPAGGLVDGDPRREVVKIFPLYALISFGCYSLFSIGSSLRSFQECPDASAELTRQVADIREELKGKGFEF